MSERYDCGQPSTRADGLRHAVAALQRGELVVVPTDTVYGIGADAFTPPAVEALLAAKGRGRDMPVPVLIGAMRTLDGLAADVPYAARQLVDAFWPGPLTIVVRHTPSLAWDLGDSRGTVAVRMPLHAVALDLLRETGPLAVSSANRSGVPPPTSASEAERMLGEAVSVYLDAGPSAATGAQPSTIVDVTGQRARVLRPGVLGLDRLREVVPDIEESG